MFLALIIYTFISQKENSRLIIYVYKIDFYENLIEI